MLTFGHQILKVNSVVSQIWTFYFLVLTSILTGAYFFVYAEKEVLVLPAQLVMVTLFV
jgi:hypothetical protein